MLPDDHVWIRFGGYTGSTLSPTPTYGSTDPPVIIKFVIAAYKFIYPYI